MTMSSCICICCMAIRFRRTRKRCLYRRMCRHIALSRPRCRWHWCSALRTKLGRPACFLKWSNSTTLKPELLSKHYRFGIQTLMLIDRRMTHLWVIFDSISSIIIGTLSYMPEDTAHPPLYAYLSCKSDTCFYPG